MSDTIAYVVGGDSWTPAYVSIYSLLRNNPTRNFQIYIFSEERKKDTFFNKLSFLRDVHDGFEIIFHRITDQEYAKLPSPKKGRLPKGFLIKILLPELLHKNNKSLLYLDADTLVVDTIEPFIKKDMSESIVAAAPDYKNLIAGLDLDLKRRYFNAGVLRINIKKWRENNITAKTIEYIEKEDPYLDDQSALNAVLHPLNMVKIISPRYNLSRSWALGETIASGDRTRGSVVDDPCIIHYYQYGKPWNNSKSKTYDETWKKYYTDIPHKGLLKNSSKLEKVLESLRDQLSCLKISR